MPMPVRMTLLSYLAYYDFYRPNCQKLETNLAKLLRSVQHELGFSEISWGPVASKRQAVLSESLMVIVKQATPEPEYTLVIRGTNPFSIQSWLFQDLDVGGLVPWSRPSPHTTAPLASISKATDTALAIHKQLSFQGQSVWDWLQTVLSDPSTSKIKLNVCGHSLGGLMSTTFAHWLHDELVAQHQRHQVDLHVASLAGPMAGNQAYVEALNAALGDQYHAYANTLDIAPLVWNATTMATLPGLYQGQIPMNPFETRLYQGLLQAVTGLGYAALTQAVPFTPELNLKLPRDYLVQAAYQHVVPYLEVAYQEAPLVCDLVLSQVLVQLIKELFTFDGWGRAVRSKRKTRRAVLQGAADVLTTKIR